MSGQNLWAKADILKAVAYAGKAKEFTPLSSVCFPKGGKWPQGQALGQSGNGDGGKGPNSLILYCL